MIATVNKWMLFRLKNIFRDYSPKASQKSGSTRVEAKNFIDKAIYVLLEKIH